MPMLKMSFRLCFFFFFFIVFYLNVDNVRDDHIIITVISICFKDVNLKPSPIFSS